MVEEALLYVTNGYTISMPSNIGHWRMVIPICLPSTESIQMEIILPTIAVGLLTQNSKGIAPIMFVLNIMGNPRQFPNGQGYWVSAIRPYTKGTIPQ
jgi:hypothetical protein